MPQFDKPSHQSGSPSIQPHLRGAGSDTRSHNDPSTVPPTDLRPPAGYPRPLTSAPSDPLLGKTIGSYRLGAVIGEGGYAIVRAAVDETGQAVALKIPKLATANAIAMLKHEYRAGRILQHPGVVSMHGLIQWEDRYAIVMEALQPNSLTTTIRGSLPRGVLPDYHWLCQNLHDLVAALVHVHRYGWVHGDIKPDNILSAGSCRPRLIDWGLSKPLDRPLWSPKGIDLVGTFQYIAPEVITHEPRDTACDIFSFGRMLSLLLSGRLPSWDPQANLEDADARIASQLPPDTPPQLLQLCCEMLRFEPAARPTAEEVYETLFSDYLSTERSNPERPNQGTHSYDAQAQRRWAQQVFGLAHHLLAGEKGPSGLWLIESHDFPTATIHRALQTTAGDRSRLILSGHCDVDEATMLPGFDAVLDQLAIWVDQLPTSLQERMQVQCGAPFHHVNARLASALGLPAYETDAHPKEETIVACIAHLIESLAEERTVVIALHDFEQIDPVSARIVERLLSASSVHPIVLLPSVTEYAKLRQNPQAARLVAQAHNVVG